MLSYRAASLHRLAGQSDNPMRSQLYLPFRDYESGHRVQKFLLEKIYTFLQLFFAIFIIKCKTDAAFSLHSVMKIHILCIFSWKVYESEDELKCRLCSLASTPSFNSTLPLARSLPGIKVKSALSYWTYCKPWACTIKLLTDVIYYVL